MNYNLRPKPKLIDPMLLNRLNKVYIAKHNGNHWILDWLYNTIYPYFRDNLLFSMIVIGLIGYLLYRYFETVKKKNKIMQNINDEAPIEVKLNKPINYDDNPKEKEKFEHTDQENTQQNNQQSDKPSNKQSNKPSNNPSNNPSNKSSNKSSNKPSNKSDELSDLSNLSEISNLSNMTMYESPKQGDFEKDIERNLQMGSNNSKKLNKMPPELIRQAILQEQQQNQQQNNQQQQFGQQQNGRQQNGQQQQEIHAHNLMTPNMPMSVLEQNMNQLKNMGQQTCSNFKTSSLYEPTALNAFSDNFMNFEEM
jgi:hypothetical protein